MDLKNKTEAKARDVAHEFVAQAEGFLAQMLGRAFDLKELSEFAEVAGATLLGSMYAILREQLGKEPSELWLKKAMVSLGSTVRLRGADALVKAEINIKDMPNKLAKREELHAPAQEAPAELKCLCKVAADGTCPTCMVKISDAMKSAFAVMVEMGKVGRKTEAICVACKAKSGDAAIARIVPDIAKSMGIGSGREGAAEEALALTAQLGMTLGVQEMPLTKEAFKEILVREEGASGD